MNSTLYSRLLFSSKIPKLIQSSPSNLTSFRSTHLLMRTASTAAAKSPIIKVEPPKNESSLLKLLSQASMIPHPRKAHKGGEDACFISTNQYGVGVADGVGGWEEVGVDPSIYSKNLMASAKLAVDQPAIMRGATSTSITQLEPLDILTYAYEASNQIIGSCTACLVILHPKEQRIKFANLGDSGFMLVRNGKVVFRSREQVKGFNFPFQLGSQSPDVPRDAYINTLKVEKGDVIIVGSDGLFDNMYDNDIVKILEEAIAKAVKATNKEGTTNMTPNNYDALVQAVKSSSFNVAQHIAAAAHQNAKNKKYDSPFAKSALENGVFYEGGKMDDITVVVSIVTNEDPSIPTSKL